MLLCPFIIASDYLGFRIAQYKFEAAKSSDQRLSSLQEILMAIKLVKFYVWESSFEEQVSEVCCAALCCYLFWMAIKSWLV